MKAKWKRKLKPNVILGKIDRIKSVGPDKRVSYSAPEYHEAMAVLRNMVEFPKVADGLNQEDIVSKAVNIIAKDSSLDESKVINEINSIIKNQLATSEYKFHILTSISLRKPYPENHIKIEDCIIRIFDSNYPKKYTGRDAAISADKSITDGTPGDYAKVIVSLKAKSVKGAATSALRVLDIQRSVWGLFCNSSMELFGGHEWSPINKIRLGGAHTVHKESGKIASDMFWYEPNFVKAKPFAPKKPEILSKNTKWVIETINSLSYGDVIKSALLRYVRALDEKDQNVALVRLWGALEELTSPSEANYGLVTRRISFLFSERDYHEQVLEHLRDYRNRNVHAGDQNERAKTSCYQLQFYFYHLVLFHLNNSGEFASLEEANNFLDLPSSIESLENRKRLVEKAIKFISPVA